MKRMMRLTTAALFGATMFATPALAQMDTNTEDPFRMGAEAETGVKIDPGTTAAIDTDLESALDLVGNSEAAAAISNFPADGEIRIVYLDEVDESDKSRIDQAMGESEAEVQELHAAIDGNAAVKSQLEAQSVDTANVLAADVAANGGIIVYVR